MAQDCQYKISDLAPTFELVGWFPNKDGLLVQSSLFKKGIFIYNSVLTDDKLTDSICEFLLSKGNEYAQFLVKKTNSDKEADKVLLDIEPVIEEPSASIEEAESNLLNKNKK